MTKKSDKGVGVSFSPELGEVIRRLKRKEPELDELVNREIAEDEHDTANGGGTDGQKDD